MTGVILLSRLCRCVTSLTCSTQLAEIAKARSDFHKTGNVDRALQQFPRQLGSERALVRSPTFSDFYLLLVILWIGEKLTFVFVCVHYVN